ncbi:hypothetical protein [Paenibacillus tengchongensis]|nr:hypothetical protein [Paenibacillus tengchongensis]
MESVTYTIVQQRLDVKTKRYSDWLKFPRRERNPGCFRTGPSG